MSEIHYISRVEYCEVRELAAMTVVKNNLPWFHRPQTLRGYPWSDWLRSKSATKSRTNSVFSYLSWRFSCLNGSRWATRSCASGFGLCPENILCWVQVTARIPSLPPQILYPIPSLPGVEVPWWPPIQAFCPCFVSWIRYFYIYKV